jgi:GH35 family endo-1,4-beta-xylanase
MYKKIILLFILIFFVLTACNRNEIENENGDETVENIPVTTPEPTPTAEPEPCATTVFVESEGSISLRIETMGSQQWDGAQVPTGALGLEVGNIYEISVDIFTAVAQGDVDISILVQSGPPLWRHIIPTPVFTEECEMQWQTFTGMFDLSSASSVPDVIQIVKNTSGPNPNVNATFYIDNFIVRLDGEIIAMFNFENGEAEPFVQSGSALVHTSVASPYGERRVTPEWDMSLPSLAQRYANYFLIGNILDPHQIRDNTNGVIEMFLHQYNSLTAENAMKVDAVSGGGNQRTRPEQLHLSGARQMVEFAEEHDLYMVGHTLLWHSQSSPWLHTNAETGEYLSREETIENLRWFIENYAGYFEGRIHAWDVTNEVFTNGGGANLPANGPEGSPIYAAGSWQRALRNYSPWYHAFANGADFDAGERAYDFVYYAFVFARRYAPSALLIYNDFNEESPHKRNAMANMTEDLNERWYNDAENNPAFGDPEHPEYGRLLIEAIGMQAHYNHGTNMQHVRDAIERFAQTGARIHVTELDIHFRAVVPAPFTMTDAQLTRQAEMYAQLFEWYVEFADYIDRVTIWGREDASSWRGDGGATHFDRFYRPKSAFWAIYDPSGWRSRI